MITKIELHDFQSHQSTSLDIGKFTVLTGGSNSGKSAVLRALAGLLNNDPVSEYVRYGASCLSVKVTTESGTVIEWKKGSGENSYFITHKDGSAEEFIKVGSEVPEQVLSELGIRTIITETNKKFNSNVHSQLESPFLVSDTASHVASVFGELTSATKLFSAVNTASSHLRTLSMTKKLRLEDKTSLLEKLDHYKYLDQTIKHIDDIGNLVLQAQTLEAKICRLSELLINVRKLQSDITHFSSKVSILRQVQEIDLSSCATTTSRLAHLLDLQDELDKTSLLVKKLTKMRSVLEGVSAAGESIPLCSSLAISYNSLTKLYNDLQSSLALLKRQSLNYESQVNEVLNLEQAINEILSTLTTCPSCGQNLSPQAKHFLVGEPC